MSSDKVKIFGERNSGTNALKQLIEKNSSSACLPSQEQEFSRPIVRFTQSRFPPRPIAELINDSLFFGRSPLHSWKHCATNFAKAEVFRGVLVLFTMRHPASWVLSLFKNPYQHLGPMPADLRSFLATPWKTVRRERLGQRSFLPLDLYRIKIDMYLELASRLSVLGIAHAFVRHEDLVLEQKAVLEKIAPELSNPSDELQPLTATTKRSSRSVDELRSYYGEERWRRSLEGLEHPINEQVDWGKLKQFGYSPL